MDKIYTMVAARLGLTPKVAESTAKLLESGATVPFISRYRKEATGGLDEVAVRDVETTLKAVRDLEARKIFVSEAIENAGAMTPQLRQRLDEADSMTEVEDIYAPYKPRKRTRATIAREKGLEPLAKLIMQGKATDFEALTRPFVGKNGVTDTDEALAGASDIIAEMASESESLRNIARNTYRRSASIVCTPAKGRDAELAASPFAQYAEFSQSVRRMPSHQYLALRRAESEGMIKVR